MALPSAVTLGSLVFVVAAGVGYGVTANAAPADVASSSAGPGSARVHNASGERLRAATKPLPTRHGASTHAGKPSRHRPDVVPNILVAVYNNTAITGLAAQKAAVLEGAGWHVAATNNWYGTIPADTVYYPPTMRPAAVKLAKVLHITRLRPAVAPMQFDRLTVILASG